MNEIDYYYLANMNLNRFPGIKDNDILFLKPSIFSGVNWLDPPQLKLRCGWGCPVNQTNTVVRPLVKA